MIVLDTSAAVEFLFATKVGRQVLAELDPLVPVAAPELFPLEVLQVVRRFVVSKELSMSRAQEVFNDVRQLPITYYPHEPLLERVWALRHNFTAYDAAYIALTEVLNATLITTDGAMRKGSGKIHSARVTVVRA